MRVKSQADGDPRPVRDSTYGKSSSTPMHDVIDSVNVQSMCAAGSVHPGVTRMLQEAGWVARPVPSISTSRCMPRPLPALGQLLRALQNPVLKTQNEDGVSSPHIGDAYALYGDILAAGARCPVFWLARGRRQQN